MPVLDAAELVVALAQVAVEFLHHTEQLAAGQLRLLVRHAALYVVADLQPLQFLLDCRLLLDFDDFAGYGFDLGADCQAALEHGALASLSKLIFFYFDFFVFFCPFVVFR